jgi:hypothetical protein
MTWLKRKDIQGTLDILENLSEICGRLGHRHTRELLHLVRTKDYLSLINYKLPYANIDRDDAVYARQIQGFYQKLENLPIDSDKALAASKSFADSEQSCLDTNRRLAYHRRKPHLRDPLVDVILHGAARKIDAILGDLPSLDELHPLFGPGANTNVNAALANPRAKLSARIECSNNTTPLLPELLNEVPAWVSIHEYNATFDCSTVDVTISPGKVVFVPKNAKTYRSIVVEPILNGFFQKGVGSFIKARLKRSGVDLYDQTRNQRLAYKGSLNDSLATLDLSNASDTLSIEVVAELLPMPWFDLLSYLRTAEVVLPETVSRFLDPNQWGSPYQFESIEGCVMLQKFSSMGNGFTFELESLIFYSLAYATCAALHLPTKEVSVFGDDIIVPKAAASRLISVLTYCGFSINLEKSYSAGPFRESCGADYLLGFDIRPYYQKSLISDQTLFSMHNWFIRSGERELAAACIQFVHPHNVIYGPDGFGDGHLIGSHTLRQNRKTARWGWAGGFFDTFTLNPRRVKKCLKGDRALPVYSVYARSGELSPTDPDIVRGSRGYSRISIYTLVDSIFHG